MELESRCAGALELRPAESSDLTWLLELRMATMAGYIESSGARLSLEDQRQRILHEFDSIQIVMRGGTDVGMMKVVRQPDVWHLVQIQVSPEYQGRGLGARLIRDLVRSACTADVPLELSVLKVNPARSLYDRLGFRVVAEDDHAFDMRFDASSQHEQ